MKAITVWQPWATLLATGQKHNETRSWKTSYRGEILIHAAKTDHSGILLHIPMEELKHFQDAGVVNKLPTGAIIGKANLVDCFQIDEAYRRKLQRENPAELAFGDYTIGRYAWVMADAILFNKPIPAKGLELWFYGTTRPSNEDTIIGFLLWYYIVRCECMKRGVWWKRGGDNGKR